MTKFRFATAVNPPKLVKSHGLWLGRTLAAIMVVMVLVHLFRIDTFVPILDQNLPGAAGWANAFAMLIILSELFALLFLLRMKLESHWPTSKVGRSFLAPLWWVLITVWSWGMLDSTGELGEFVAVYADPLTLIANLVWLSVSYYATYTLGYNSLKLNLKDLKRKNNVPKNTDGARLEKLFIFSAVFAQVVQTAFMVFMAVQQYRHEPKPE